MQDRILKTGNGQFKSGQWTGKNESLIEPVCDKIVVLPDEALEKTTGGIIIPDDQKGRQSVAALSGLLVAVGPQAFAYDSNRLVRWEGWRPRPGDRIVFSRFSGEEYPGADGRTYRVMQDTCVGGVVERAPDRKPTVEELEKILQQPDDLDVEILPNGEVRAVARV